MYSVHLYSNMEYWGQLKMKRELQTPQFSVWWKNLTLKPVLHWWQLVRPNWLDFSRGQDAIYVMRPKFFRTAKCPTRTKCERRYSNQCRHPSGYKWKIISRGVGWCVIRLLLKGEVLNLELKCFQKKFLEAWWAHWWNSNVSGKGSGGGVASCRS